MKKDSELKLMHHYNYNKILTRQCTTHIFLGFCRSHKCIFLQIANKLAKVGAFLASQPHSDT